jgi:predicted metal-binding membrane protein
VSRLRTRALPATGDLPALALAASAAAWAGLWLAAHAAGGSGLGASSMSVGTGAGSLALFLVAWEAMVVAMMLPASVGFLVLFRAVTGEDRRPCVRRTAVCIGYALAWAWMGFATILVSEALYRDARVDAWLGSHTNFLAGGVLTLAGVFQVTALKRRCLSVCSHPAAFLMRHYRRGVGAALELGLRFGLVCVGCCWALMAALIVLGGGSLALMALLAAIMFAERALGWDDRFTRGTGLACIAFGVFLAACPGAVPALAQNAGRWVQMSSPTMMHVSHHVWLPWCRA